MVPVDLRKVRTSQHNTVAPLQEPAARPAGAGKRPTRPSQCRKVHLQDVTKAAECMNAKVTYFAVLDLARVQYITHQHAVRPRQDDGRMLAVKAIQTPSPVLQQY